jgi:glycosyltransferase involved in cell wall biosynthesis
MLRKTRPQVVIVGGWDHAEYLAAYAFKRLAGFEIVLWTESTALDWRPTAPFRTTVKHLLIRSSAAVVVPGSAAEEYARTLGATKVATAPNACEVEILVPDAAAGADHDQVPTVLFVGRLALEKGVDVLLRAWGRLGVGSAARLVIIGSGPLESELKQLASDLGLTNVEWLPFGEPAQAQRWYRRAQMLVLPSRSEPWGFVINEAMAAHLPVIATDVCGASRDLIEDGATGWIVRPDDPDGLSRCIKRALTDGAGRSAVAAAAAAKISSYTPLAWASAMAGAVRSVASSPGRPRQR